jgi:hypothetical protein
MQIIINLVGAIVFLFGALSHIITLQNDTIKKMFEN